MDVVIALSQGLGLAVAAGFVAAPPVALAATAASVGVADEALGVADEPVVVAIAWAAAVAELVADAIWPGAQAGARLWRRVVGGGLAFELVAGRALPLAGLAIGAVLAGAMALALRQVRSRAVKAGGDIRGTALIEDGAGLAASVIGVIPFVGYPMAIAASGLYLRSRRREQEKYRGLRVLR